MTDYTPHQRDIIGRYYNRRDEIMLTKLSEIVSELMVAQSEASKKRLWSRAEKAMRNLKVPEPLVRHILDQHQPEVLARNVRDWLASISRPGNGQELQ